MKLIRKTKFGIPSALIALFTLASILINQNDIKAGCNSGGAGNVSVSLNHSEEELICVASEGDIEETLSFSATVAGTYDSVTYSWSGIDVSSGSSASKTITSTGEYTISVVATFTFSDGTSIDCDTESEITIAREFAERDEYQFTTPQNWTPLPASSPRFGQTPFLKGQENVEVVEVCYNNQKRWRISGWFNPSIPYKKVLLANRTTDNINRTKTHEMKHVNSIKSFAISANSRINSDRNTVFSNKNLAELIVQMEEAKFENNYLKTHDFNVFHHSHADEYIWEDSGDIDENGKIEEQIQKDANGNNMKYPFEHTRCDYCDPSL